MAPLRNTCFCFLLAPLALLPWKAALCVWIGISLVALAAMLVTVANVAGIRLSTMRGLVFLAMCLGLAPIHTGLATANPAIVGVALSVVALWFAGRKQDSLAGVLIALAFRGYIGLRTRTAIAWIDAAAVGLFAVAGSTRALDAHMTVLPAVILGTMTAVGGGAIRDVLSGRTPQVFESGQPYAIAAVLASASFLLCNSLLLTRVTSTTVGLAVGFLVRMLSLRFNLKTRSVRDNVPSGF